MKLRVRFQKLGKVRWISHRDIARCIERAVRRANLPVAYSEGFTPRPRISFGLALPTGAESLAEYLDIDFGNNEVDFDAVGPALSAGLPLGIDVTGTATLPPRADSLQESVARCRWELGVFNAGNEQIRDAAWFAHAASSVMATQELVVTRERKGVMVTDDIRPNIAALSAEARPDGTPILVADLNTLPRGIRPAELGLALELPVARLDVRRTHQWIAPDGVLTEPLTLDESSHSCPSLPPTTPQPPGDVAGGPIDLETSLTS
ncbi:MAG: TIGR03936 family radical SAM-associated protein [Acidimicrobiales bacterium]|nr:TIGR03936 family radical SAM-associated protein [Acidimicrobiales bacterium]